MIYRKSIFIFILYFMLILGLSGIARSGAEIYPQDIRATLQYDDNVTRERFQKDYQYGIVWWLNTGFGVRNLIPVEGLNTKADYILRMRDVSTTNDEDLSSHRISLLSEMKIRTGTNISLEEAFELRNSQNDLFNFFDNRVKINVDQSFGGKTRAFSSYTNEKKEFQNNAPEVQARNFLYHQISTDISHKISDDFAVQVGYVYQYSMYNRSPIDLKNGRPVVLDGVQRDRRNVINLGFRAMLFNYTTDLQLVTQMLRSNSNSRAFNFSGNKTRIILAINPLTKLSLWFDYQIVGYDLGDHQTPNIGYELSEIRTDDHSYVKLGATYRISPQVHLEIDYEHIENTARFPGESYKKNTLSTGLRIKF